MLEDKDRIFKNLYNDFGADLTSAKQRGDWNNTKAILDRFPGFSTFAGSEGFLLDTLRNGGAGCITASGNANPAGI